MHTKTHYLCSACVASIVRVTAFNQVDPEDVPYTITPAGIWTVIEQSMGIICACLPTTRPIFDRVRSNGKNSNSSATHDTATRVPLGNFSSRSNLRPLADISKAGFARLDEEIALEPNSVSTHASMTPRGGLPVVTDGIVKQQTLEQHYDRRFPSWNMLWEYAHRKRDTNAVDQYPAPQRDFKI